MASTSTYATIGRAGVAVAAVVAGLAGAGAVALLVRPAALPPVASPRPAPRTVPVPDGLPDPVARWARTRFGEHVPVVETVVVTGRGTIRVGHPGRVRLPVRFRFWQEVGRAYRHYIEVCLAGVPVARVNEWFADGEGRGEVLGDVVEHNPKWDQGANLGLWIEAFAWFPSALLTAPGVRWEPFDADSAVLVVPFGESSERILVRFDPAGGDIRYWEMLRFSDGEGEKRLYVNGVWVDDGRPWADFRIDDVAVNVPVDVSPGTRGAH